MAIVDGVWTISNLTFSTPCPGICSIRAAPYDKSMIRVWGTGPRSFTRTITDLLLRRFVTFTRVPRGNLRWAAVNWNISYGSPLAVSLPWNCLPYQDAF